MLSKAVSERPCWPRLVSGVPLLTPLVIAVAIACVGFYVSSKLLLLLTGAMFGLLVCLVLGSKSILGILGAVFMIGYLQGAIELFVELPIDLGVLKYALLLGGGALWAARIMISGRCKVSRRIFGFILLSVLFYSLFVHMLVRSLAVGDVDRASIIEMISLWGALNIPLAPLVYSDLRSLTTIYRFLRVLVWLGVFAAVIGIIQYLLGPDRLLALGIDVYSMQFALLRSDQVFEFRAFSVFPTHYEFASFMVVGILAKSVLQLRARCRPGPRSLAIFFLLFGGLLVTFNVTLWLVLVSAVGVMLLGWWGKGVRTFRSKRVYKLALAALILGLLAMVVIPPFRERILGIFAFKSGAVGTAGKSLYYRTMILGNSLNLIREFPGGLGPSIHSVILRLQEQRGWLLVTSDAFFMWLALVGGLPLLFCYLSFLVWPLWVSFRRRGAVPAPERPLFWALWAWLFIGVVLGGVSNSAFLNGTPTNLLVWASIGVLLKMTDWRHTQFEAVQM
jgi:hypothetical protein